MTAILFAALVCFPLALLSGVSACAMWYDRRLVAAAVTTLCAVAFVILGSLAVALQ